MRLTQTLNFIRFKLPRGNIFRGKNRLVKPVSKASLETLKQDLEREEKNLFYLRHPYLTVEQSQGHVQHLDKHTEWHHNKREERNEKFAKHRTLADEFSHLKVSENWDFTGGSKIS